MGIGKLPSIKSAIKKATAPKNPLDALVNYTGNQEADSLAELEAVAKGQTAAGVLIDRQREAIERNNDTEFWACIVFNSRAQKEAVLSALGLLDHGDKYIDGHVFAEAVGVACPPDDFVPKRPKHDPKLDALT